MFRRSGRGRLLLLAFLALSIVIITLDFRQGSGGPIERAKDLSAEVVAPIQRGLATVVRPVGDFFSSLGDIGDLRAKNEELEAELEEAEARLSYVSSLEDENRKLRATVEVEPSFPTMDTVVAEVFADVPSNYKWAVAVDKGEDDGIEKGMAVTYARQLVGQVIRTTDDTADVLLLIDPVHAAGAKIDGLPGKGAVVTGNGAEEDLSMKLVDPESDIDVGDTVLTSGYDGGVFPPNIPIGVVSEVGPPIAGSEREIRIDPFVDFKELQFVQVLLESGGDTIAEDGK